MSVTILAVAPLPEGPWPTLDPFLFCVHHDDNYPAGDGEMRPKASLEGRSIGHDFGGKDGWSMYHGDTVPGFPQHPHRGFETVTVARQGYIDHSDSLGAAARFGEGDLQWMTAGRGVVHSEMFPLLNQDTRNPTELFQIWLNLPAVSKMAQPHFSMFWKNKIPSMLFSDGVKLVSYAGALPDGQTPPAPPPSSWASDPANNVAIWTIKLGPGTEWTLPATHADVVRCLYLFAGGPISIDGQQIEGNHVAQVNAGHSLILKNGGQPSELLMLQGMPIGEPVAQHGPFVMNSRDELSAAFADYRQTAFGGWPWPQQDPVHPMGEGRFARFPDGQIERPE
jgi:redox-sensitive bicupin YhaK (pirin superfamily)